MAPKVGAKLGRCRGGGSVNQFICLISWGSHKFWLRILQLLKKKLKNTGSGKRTQFLGDSSQLGTRQCSGSPPGILTGFLGDGWGWGGDRSSEAGHLQQQEQT